MAVIAVSGNWHQGVVLGAAFANLGWTVRGLADSPEHAARLAAGESPVREPGLPELMVRGIASGRLRYTAVPEEAVAGADFLFLSLDTPVSDDDAPELEPLFAAVRRAAAALAGDVILVVTAQVPVGTCERLRESADQVAGGHAVRLAYVPEFLRLGQALNTFTDADRFIIGADDDAVADRVEELLAPLHRPILRMDVRSAEMTKHACNAFLAASISFANEVADLCDATGADIESVTAGMRLDRRIGPHAFLSAGLGFAGGTLGRDLRSLQELGRSHDMATHLVDAALEVNQRRADLVLRRLLGLYGTVDRLRIGILGLTYKPMTNTMRRSVALSIIRDLAARGAIVSAYDPLATMDGVDDPPPFERVSDALDAAADADALVLVTEFAGLDELDMRAIREAMRRPVLIDTRNVLDAGEMERHGFIYTGVGRGRQARLAGTALEVAT
jgi:UDPglucose 6-dehydrogenase